MNLFGQKVTAESLSKKSADILDVFRSTITSLNDVNTIIDAQVSEKNKEMEALKLEQDLLIKTKKQ